MKCAHNAKSHALPEKEYVQETQRITTLYKEKLNTCRTISKTVVTKGRTYQH